MKKAVLLAVAACLVFASAAFAFEGKTSTDKQGSYIEQMAKKKSSKKKTTPPAN
ncbi:hypothetical protein NNJEOMEG_01192 [Fundidesulfovibrio magnetotacticus]|uniref:Uncharacterized protein n=1 Tax=Fundidesulfovibrio magnetotacticus TaxID=2730080 RepID=A0A6V8LQU4_9BACT|nr:hypothetical protein [Fundidesulfovibrio magnetotacticus]GFK93360.1 hypothetical protein NNJEOMEG_01192 [Fundidesulfovibrio magnetotacticus]